ncbi:MAG: sugar phosphate nucleotidyltransferase [Acidobacteriota bacterium]
MLLAAGFGGRMVPITFFRAKPVLPFMNRPLLLRQIDYLSKAGVDEIVVNLHHRPASILSLLRDAAGGLRGHRAGEDLRLGDVTVHISREPAILGTSGGVRAAADHFKGSGTFLCVNSDVVSDIDLAAAIETHRRAGRAATLVLRPAPANSGYTAVWHDGKILRGFGRDDAPSGSCSGAGIFTGIHLLEPEVLDHLPDGRSEFVPDLYRPMIAAGDHPAVHVSTGDWHEVGTPERYLAAHRAVRPDGPVLGAGCRIASGARLEPDAILGKHVRVQAGTRIEASVVMDGASIGEQSRLRQVIVGPGTDIPAGLSLERVVVDGGHPDAEIPPTRRSVALRDGLWHASF